MAKQKQTPEDKFVKLAEKRVSKVLHDIRLIGNLASPNYHKTDYQVECIKLALENATAEMSARFEQHYQQDEEGFSFDNFEPEAEAAKDDAEDEIETIVHKD